MRLIAGPHALGDLSQVGGRLITGRAKARTTNSGRADYILWWALRVGALMVNGADGRRSGPSPSTAPAGGRAYLAGWARDSRMSALSCGEDPIGR